MRQPVLGQVLPFEAPSRWISNAWRRTWMAPDLKSRVTTSCSAAVMVACRKATPDDRRCRRVASFTLARCGSMSAADACGDTQHRCTMRFGSTAKVLAKCMLEYYRISECDAIILNRCAGDAPSSEDDLLHEQAVLASKLEKGFLFQHHCRNH